MSHKKTTPKPIRVKSKKSRLIETEQIKPVQQAISQVMENQMQLDKVTGNYNELFPQVNPQLQISIDPFLLEDQFQEIVDFSDLKTCHDFGDLENSCSL